jgi:hypothetical protein
VGIPESRQTYCHEKGIKFFPSRTFEPKLCNRNALVDSYVFYVTVFFYPGFLVAVDPDGCGSANTGKNQ